MRLLFIGDIVGKPGRDLLRRALPRIVSAYAVDFTIVNVENSAGGFGVTPEIADEILAYGVDVMTTGNHIWDKKEILPYLPDHPRLLRPMNYAPGAPGAGMAIAPARGGEPVAVLNAMGRVYMSAVDDPFRAVDAAVDQARRDARVVFVDFHAEVTSEKMAMGWHLDGRVTAIVGTHTHVQTADERVLPGGTAYITDVGMTGPHDSVIGVEKSAAIRKFITGLPAKFDTATGDPRLHAVVIEADPLTGRAHSIERLSLAPQDLDTLRSTAGPSGAAPREP